MRSYAVVEWGKPLQAIDRPDPEPQGTEVLLRVRRAGVCHSDLHIHEGFFDWGEMGKFRMEDRGMKLPHTLGHEILGEVVAMGPDAKGVEMGATRILHPWLGCDGDDCKYCSTGRENDCPKPQAIGIVHDGGYATHVMAPHPKWLVNVDGLDLDTVTPHACSGVTVFTALKKVLQAEPAVEPDEWLAIFGCGGLGLNAVTIADAMGHRNIIAVDVDDAKLEAAKEMGATVTFNSATGTTGDLMKLAGGALMAVVDTVGIEPTSRMACDALTKNGRYVIVGLHGGTFKMPLPVIPTKQMTVRGSYVGSKRDLEELLDLVRQGGVKPLPVEVRPLDQAWASLEDLKAGRVTGRIVLTGD